MGNWASIRVKPDQESIACPGEKSAMSDPIGEDLIDNVEEFFAELVETVKDPIDFMKQENWLTKEIEIKSKDPDNFDIKVMFDGAKLKKLIPWKENEDDYCRYRFAVNVDREKLYMKTAGLDPETEKEAGLRYHTQFHRNKEEKTVRIEIWAFDDEGNRRSGEHISGYAELIWVKPLLLCRLGQKVKVSSNIESYDTGGRSALTEPLDDYFTADQFYEALVDSIKQEGIDFKASIAYKSDTEFTMDWEHDFPLPTELVNQESGVSTWHFSFQKKVLLDPVNRQIVLHEHLWQELTLTQFYRITKEPVRCEFWQAWAEGEIESLLDRLIAKKTLLELPDMPFRQGTKVFAVLTEDDQWHPAVVQREVRFADMWEGGGPPAESGCADTGEAEGADASSAAPQSSAEPTQTCPPSRQKKSSRKAKVSDICTSWFQNRFFEVRFSEFGKMQFARFDKLMLNETVDDDEGVEGMVCEEGECEVCKRSIFLTFHHLIPKQTHSRWLRRKRLPEGVRGYESGSRKMLPSSAVKSASGGKTGAAQKKSSAVVKAGKVKSSSAGDENLCTRHFLNTYGIMVCRQCHAQIHHMASNMELAMRYNTLERVLHAPAMERCARF